MTSSRRYILVFCICCSLGAGILSVISGCQSIDSTPSPSDRPSSSVLSAASSCRPPSTPTDLSAADQLVGRGLYREAIRAYEDILKRSPQLLLAHRNLGITLVRIGLYHRGCHHLQQSYPRHQHSFYTLFYLAECSRMIKRYGPASALYHRALHHRPQDMKTSLGLAWSYYNLHQHDQALTVLTNLSKDQRSHSEVEIMTARIHLKQGRTDQARLLMQALLTREKHTPYTPFILALIGDIFYQLHQHPKALRYYKKALSLQPHLASALLGQGRISYHRGEYQQAKQLLQRSVHILADQEDAYYYLARIHHHQQPQEALRYYRLYLRTSHENGVHIPEKIHHVNRHIYTLTNSTPP